LQVPKADGTETGHNNAGGIVSVGVRVEPTVSPGITKRLLAEGQLRRVLLPALERHAFPFQDATA
jgi:hypothetical protein